MLRSLFWNTRISFQYKEWNKWKEDVYFPKVLIVAVGFWYISFNKSEDHVIDKESGTSVSYALVFPCIGQSIHFWCSQNLMIGEKSAWWSVEN